MDQTRTSWYWFCNEGQPAVPEHVYRGPEGLHKDAPHQGPLGLLHQGDLTYGLADLLVI